jgi:hypothetical protein
MKLKQNKKKEVLNNTSQTKCAGDPQKKERM